MQTCYNCGKVVDDNVLICPDCGALVKRYTAPPARDAEPAASPASAPAAASAQNTGFVVRDENGKLRIRGFLKVWLILCIAAACYTIFSFWFVFSNEDFILETIRSVDAVMAQDLEEMLAVFHETSYLFIAMGVLQVVKIVCYFWLLLRKQKLAFWILLGADIAMALPSLLQLSLFGALSMCLDVVVIWICLKKNWDILPK